MKLLSDYAVDFQAYCRDCILIRDKNSRRNVPFLFNRPQKRFWEEEQKDIAEGKPVRQMRLKPRKIGSTIYEAVRALHGSSLSANTSSLIVSHKDELTEDVFIRLKSAFSHVPEELRPSVKLDNRKVLYFEAISSMVRAVTAKGFEPGRGFTVDRLLLTEFAYYDEVCDVEKFMLAALNAMPDSPHTSIVIESTANGDTEFKRMWYEDNEFRKIFIPFVAMDEYRLPTKGFEFSEIDDSRYGNETKIAEIIRSLLIEWYPEKNYLAGIAADYELNEEIAARLAWRRHYIDTKCRGDKVKFAQEYPLTPEEAFAVTAKTIFPSEILSAYRTEVERKLERDYRMSLRPIRERPKNWWLDALTASKDGNLIIHHMPDPLGSYIIPADSCQGIAGRDKAALRVISVPDLIECASLDAVVDTYWLADMLVALSHFFNDALLVPESNGIGLALIKRLTDRKIFGENLNIFRQYFLDAGTRMRTPRYGWSWTLGNKPSCIDDLRSELLAGRPRLASLETIEQLEHFGSRGKLEGPQDGAVMCWAMAIAVSRTIPEKGVEEEKKKKAYNTLDWWDENFGATELLPKYGDLPN